MRSWLSVLITDAESKKVFDIPIAPSLYSLSNKMDNSLLAVRDINHKYIVVGKYYANIDGEMIEITKEVAYAMNNFYRSSKAKKVEIKNELGEVVDKMLREVPYSGQSIDGEGFMIEDFPDLNCDVEHSVLTKMEQQDIHKVINQLNSEERMIIYGIFFENKTQTQMAEIMGISRQMLSYKLKSILNKMREMYMNKFF